MEVASPSAPPPAKNQEEDDEVDPLDAYMSEIRKATAPKIVVSTVDLGRRAGYGSSRGVTRDSFVAATVGGRRWLRD